MVSDGVKMVKMVSDGVSDGCQMGCHMGVRCMPHRVSDRVPERVLPAVWKLGASWSAPGMSANGWPVDMA